MCTLLSTVLKCRMVANGCGRNVTCTAMENLIFPGHCLIQENTDWYAHELVQGICTARQQYRYMKFINFRNTGCGGNVTCTAMENLIFPGHCLIQENTDWYAHELVQGICTARQQYRYMKFINFRNTVCTRKYFLHLTYSVHDVTCSGTGNSA